MTIELAAVLGAALFFVGWVAGSAVRGASDSAYLKSKGHETRSGGSAACIGGEFFYLVPERDYVADRIELQRLRGFGSPGGTGVADPRHRVLPPHLSGE